jgi:putative hemolysin
MRDPRRVLLTILVANTVINVLIFSISYVLFRRLSVGRSGLWVSLGSVSSLVAVVVFGEIVPKAVALAGPRRVATLLAPVVSAAGYLLTPVRLLLHGLVIEPLVRLLAPGAASPALISTEELRLLIEASHRRGAIDPDESALLQGVLELGRIKVREVMVPRVDIKAFDVNAQPEALRDFMRRHRLKKVPAFDGDIDEMVGVIYAKRLFLQRQTDLRRLVQPVRYVPEQMRLDQLLQHFRQTRTQLAIVVDEFGGTAGLVTLEDVLEQIVGQIESRESAPEVPAVQQLDERSFLVAGGLSIHEWVEAFGQSLADPRVSTVAGLVLARLGRIPQIGEAVRIGNVQVTVMQMRGRRIERLKVELVEPMRGAEAIRP